MEQTIPFSYTAYHGGNTIELVKIYEENNRLIVLFKMTKFEGKAGCALTQYQLNLRLQINSGQPLPVSYVMLYNNRVTHNLDDIQWITDEANLALSPHAIKLYDGGFHLPRQRETSAIVIVDGIAYQTDDIQELQLTDPKNQKQAIARLKRLEKLQNHLKEIMREEEGVIVKQKLHSIPIDHIIIKPPTRQYKQLIATKSIEVIRQLMEIGFDFNAKKGLSLLNNAIAYGYDDIVRLLLAYHVDLKAIDKTSLAAAIRDGHTMVVRELFLGGHGLDCDIRIIIPGNHRYDYVLDYGVYALETQNIDMINIILSACSDVDAQTAPGITALMCATTAGNEEIVDMLIKNDAYVNIQTNTGETALMMATKRGFTPIVKLLLDANVCIKMKNKSGETALDYAMQQNKKEIKQLLLGSKIKYSSRCNEPNESEFSIVDITNPNEKIRYCFFNAAKQPLLRVEQLDSNGYVKSDSKKIFRANYILITIDEEQDIRLIANQLNLRLMSIGMPLTLEINKLIWKNKKWQCKIEFPSGSGFFAPLMDEAKKMGLNPTYDVPDIADKQSSSVSFLN